MVVVVSPMPSRSSEPEPALYVTAATPKRVSISMGHTCSINEELTLCMLGYAPDAMNEEHSVCPIE